MPKKARKPSRTAARYSDEFKQKAVAMLAGGSTLVVASKKLGVSVPTLISWKKRESGGAAKKIGRGGSGPLTPHDEIRQLRFELAKAIEERDRLRKSMAFLIGAQA
jgi:transposase-like protein